MDARETRSIYLFGRRFGNIKSFTPTQKLWLSFGILTTLLAVVCVVILIRMQSLEKFLHEQATLNRPRTMATMEMEANTLDYALAVRTQMQQADQETKNRVNDAADRVGLSLARYSSLARTPQQQQLQDRFSTLWQEMKDQGQTLLEGQVQPANAEGLKEFNAICLEMGQFLNNEVQPEAATILNSQRNYVLGHMRANQGFLFGLLAGSIILGGTLSLLIGSAITRENESLRESRSQLQKVIDKVAIPTMLHDGNNILLINEAWTNLTGFRQEDIPTISDWKKRAQVESAGFNKDHLDSLSKSTCRVDHGESVVTTAEGLWRNWRFYTTPLGMEPDGRCLMVCNALDVTERPFAQDQAQIGDISYSLPDQRQEKILEEYRQQLEDARIKLSNLANLDELTHLHSRRALQEKLADEVKRTARYGLPISLLLVDVDQYQQFNDTFGNPAGEEVLRDVGRVLSETTRSTDFAARYGGEEFAILLPGTGSKGATTSAEKIRRAVAEEPWQKRNITVSVGVATLTAGYGDGSELMEQADNALYHGKKTGTNCVHVATTNEGIPMAMW